MKFNGKCKIRLLRDFPAINLRMGDSLTLLKLSKENDKPEYEKAADNDDIVDEIARDIRRAIENGCDYDWCFDTSKYGGFMDSYNTAIVVFGEEE